MKIETKYAIGDKVYHARVKQVRKQLDCPDCLGTKKWKAISPAGSEYEFDCPRCGHSYVSREQSLDYMVYEPAIRPLTIGSVRTDSNDEPGKRNSYMCHETGVGSGTVYYEKDLGATQEEAYARALEICVEQNKGPDIVERYSQAVVAHAYDLKSLREKQEIDESRALRYKIEDLVSELGAAQSLTEVRDTLDKVTW